MTQLKLNAWWCEYCARCIKKQCTADVPYYASSPMCDKWQEHAKLIPRKKVNVKKYLVEVI